MARTKLEHWPDGLLLQILQLDQLTKLNEQVVGLKKALLGAIAKMADLIELIEKSLPTAPHVPDEEEAAEAEWQAQMNRELGHASIVDPVEARQALFADLLAKNLPGITPNVVLATHFTAAMRAQGMDGFAREMAPMLWSAGFVFWGRACIGDDNARVWVSESFQEILRKEAYPEQKILGYLAEVDFDRRAAHLSDQGHKNTGKTPENVSCPPGTVPTAPYASIVDERKEKVEIFCRPATDTATIIDPDHYA